MSDLPPLSVVILTLDEASNIERCLESVAWADERLVVDAGSKDGTRSIAERLGARVVTRPWRGFVDARNAAVELATHDWVLALDADEWLEPASETAVRRAIARAGSSGFVFERRSAFCGAFLKYAWRPDRQLRLFDRRRARWRGGYVHERVHLDAGERAVRLDVALLHVPYRTMEAYLERANRYTSLGARTAIERHERGSIGRLVLSPIGAFLKVWLVQRGVLDGVRGFVVAAGSAATAFAKHAKIWDATRERDPGFDREVPPTPDDPDPGARWDPAADRGRDRRRRGGAQNG